MAPQNHAPLLLHRLLLYVEEDPANAIADSTLYLGTAMASLSGTISAGRAQMDLFGCVVVAVITAIGGGTTRDLILGRSVYWVADRAHLLIALIVAISTFVVWPFLTTHFASVDASDLVFLWSDAIGMASSSIMGSHIGILQTRSSVIAIVCGTLTAVAGGIIRDVLCQEKPRALYAERSMYATPALFGAAAYACLYEARQRAIEYGVGSAIPRWLTAVLPWSIALLLRAAAWTFRLSLPHWARRKSRRPRLLKGPEPTGEEFEVVVTAASGTNAISTALRSKLSKLL